MQTFIGKTLSGAASLTVLMILSSNLAFAGGQSLRKDCKLDKLGNGPRHCQCEALRHHLLPKKILLRLSEMNVCNVIQTGNGGQSSSNPPRDDCYDGGDEKSD